MTTIRQNLRAARKLIENPKNWHKGSWSAWLSHDFRDLSCLCMGGALCVARAADKGHLDFKWYLVEDEAFALEAALRELHPSRKWYIPEFNDHADTTHEMVLAVFDHAIASIKPTPYDLLLEGADYIEKHGWAQGTFLQNYDEPSCACAVGSMLPSLSGFPMRRQNFDEAIGSDVLGCARRALSTHVGAHHVSALYGWHDSPSRTKEEVVAAMRAAAEKCKPVVSE